MEFYVYADCGLTEQQLQDDLRIDNLPQYCASIDKVLSNSGDKGEIYSVWGEFSVHRQMIRNGVRFTLPRCPNALQWTITTNDPNEAKVFVHCSINQITHDRDFIKSIEQFVEDWKVGLETMVPGMTSKVP